MSQQPPCRRTVIVFGGAALLFSATPPTIAVAHHGVTGSYDTSSPIVLSGRITRAVFAPPHPELTIRVEPLDEPLPEVDRPDEFTGPFLARDADLGQERVVEFSPVRPFYDLAGRVQEGDHVLVLALRNCRPPNQLRSSWIRLADGLVVSHVGGWHRRTDGCK